MPHAPQLYASDEMLTHRSVAAQSVTPAPHVTLHTPPIHARPGAHARPKPPQLSSSEAALKMKVADAVGALDAVAVDVDVRDGVAVAVPVRDGVVGAVCECVVERVAVPEWEAGPVRVCVRDALSVRV